MIKIYKVYCESDMTEGRGPKKLVLAFLNENDAWDYANKQSGIMGRKPTKGDWRTYSGGRDWDVKPMNAYETLEESTKEHKEKLKKSALAKLTQAEKQALGL